MLDLYLALGLGFIVGYIIYKHHPIQLKLDAIFTLTVLLIVFFIGFNAGLNMHEVLAQGLTILTLSLLISLINIVFALIMAMLLRTLVVRKRG